jgi:predicted aldo/keto reductase-like oxidoreductase
MSSKELEIIEEVQIKYAQLGYIGCTKCLYCQPCPQGVAIPDILTILNDNYSKSREEAKKAYNKNISENNRASKCNRCGTCEEQCPQQLPIQRLMTSANRMYELN